MLRCSLGQGPERCLPGGGLVGGMAGVGGLVPLTQHRSFVACQHSLMLVTLIVILQSM